MEIEPQKRELNLVTYILGLGLVFFGFVFMSLVLYVAIKLIWGGLDSNWIWVVLGQPNEDFLISFAGEDVYLGESGLFFAAIGIYLVLLGTLTRLAVGVIGSGVQLVAPTYEKDIQTIKRQLNELNRSKKTQLRGDENEFRLE